MFVGLYYICSNRTWKLHEAALLFAAFQVATNGAVVIISELFAPRDYDVSKLPPVTQLEEAKGLLSGSINRDAAEVDADELESIYLTPWKYMKDRGKYIRNQAVVWNVLLHLSSTYLMNNVVGYPLMLAESEPSTPKAERGVHDFCSDHLTNLMSQGAVLYATYLVGSLVYRYFFVKMPPIQYYGFVMAGVCILTGACLGVLMVDVGQGMRYALVAVAQVLPYYMKYVRFFSSLRGVCCSLPSDVSVCVLLLADAGHSNYDYYVFVTVVEEQYYGFMNAIYGILQLGVLTLTGYMTTLNLPIMPMLWGCVGLLLIVSAHGLYIRGFFTGQTWSSAAQVVTVRKR